MYERKYQHSFIVKLDDKDYEGAIAKTFRNGCFILASDKYITFFNKKKESRFSIEIDDVDEDVEIISMNLSQDERRLAIALGTRSVGADESISQIVVYEISLKKEIDGNQQL